MQGTRYGMAMFRQVKWVCVLECNITCMIIKAAQSTKKIGNTSCENIHVQYSIRAKD